eukprot:6699422-Prymnesium_polylepis.1
MAPWEPPNCNYMMERPQSDLMVGLAASNASLINYLFPETGVTHTEQTGWRVATSGCKLEIASCWCFHVPGSMVKRLNPRGHERCVPKWKVENCSEPDSKFAPLAE